MEWSVLVVAALVAIFWSWQHSRNKEKAEAATEQLRKDNELYQHIKSGMREFDWRSRTEPLYTKRTDRELLFETAHLQAFHVKHHAEYRVGFYFKDLNEYGLYGSFTGNDDDHYESYYRTDSTFQKEEQLLHD